MAAGTLNAGSHRIQELNMTRDKGPGVCGAHLSKIAKGGAASFVVVLRIVAVSVLCCCVAGGSKTQNLPWVSMENGRIVYGEDTEHSHIPDFSTAGYEGGGVALPDVPVKMRVEAAGDQDATGRIQNAI